MADDLTDVECHAMVVTTLSITNLQRKSVTPLLSEVIK